MGWRRFGALCAELAEDFRTIRLRSVGWAQIQETINEVGSGVTLTNWSGCAKMFSRRVEKPLKILFSKYLKRAEQDSCPRNLASGWLFGIHHSSIICWGYRLYTTYLARKSNTRQRKSN